MKRLKCVIAFCLLAFLSLSLLFSCGNSEKDVRKIDLCVTDEIKESYQKGRSKQTTDLDDIERIMEFINGLEKEETEKTTFDSLDSVSIKIHYNYEIERFCFRKGYYSYYKFYNNNETYYKLSDEDYSRLMLLYDELDCEEYAWTAME